MIEFNKKMQKKLELDRRNIKKILGRYHIKINKEIVQELDLNTNLLLYEGNYYNRKKDGNGKKYNNDGKVIFEGIYLNGEKNGIGKEFYTLLIKKEEKLKYYGFYLNGKRHGNGKEFYINGKIRFEGEYNEGKIWNGKGYNNNGDFIFEIKNGFGKINEYSDFGNLIYTGYYKDGQRDGTGSENYFNQKLKFAGEYYKGQKWNGIGYDIEGNKIFYIYNGIGKVKEYDNIGKLIFKGIYSNGMKWGTGKEYFDYNKLKFSGNYLYGKRNGFGYEYYKNGNLSYKGNFWNDKRHGKGKEYYDNGNLKYEGNFCYGKIFGVGKEYYNNDKEQIMFEGEYINGKRWEGKLYRYNKKNKLKSEEEYIKGKLTGKIIQKLYYESGILKFSGECLNKEKNGKGEEYSDKGILIFEGNYSKGLRHGQGNEYDSTGKLKYKGIFINGKRSIKGEEYDENKNILYKGEYLNGNRHGEGVLFYKGKLKYKGEFQFGKLFKGKIYNYHLNGQLKFIGDYINNEITGKGIEFNEKGEKIYEGDFVNEDREGYGRIYEKENIINYEGEFIKNKKIGFGRGYNRVGNLKFEVLRYTHNTGFIRFFNDEEKVKSEYKFTNGVRNKNKIKFTNELNDDFEEKSKILDAKFGIKRIKKEKIKFHSNEIIELEGKRINANKTDDDFNFYLSGVIKGAENI